MRFSGIKTPNLPDITNATDPVLRRMFQQYNLVIDDVVKDINYRAQEAYWDDLRVAASSIRRLGFSDPDWVQFADDNGVGDTGTSTGVYLPAFDTTTEEEVFFDVQMPHAWKEGSTLYPHVHWAPSSAAAGGVTWGLEYTWQNVNGAFGATSTITFDDSTTTTSHAHLIASNSTGIDGDGKTLSSILACRLYRDVGDANDTYAADAFLLSFDIHYEMDFHGSIKEYTKWTS